MENAGYCDESFSSLQSGTSDEDMVEIAGATLDFSSTDDVPPLDRDYVSGTYWVLLGTELAVLVSLAFRQRSSASP
ncbi:H(+)/Cl(-) exchange transporter 5-like [Brienomyrus brachyistius]|uniref:H(+)/Cl(-) exchange transporter 5-like n=1 Tax=Brienomyrus brachyistius TaxID=42636 RepID=UPI0020B3F70C|nr:H(+)/Cl(-) exchange transporter 5-like [Brienomyrus brachyistius]